MQATLDRLRERRERGDEGGFTLIELLIVIVILGILAAIVVFAVQNLTSSSVQSSCRADFKTVQTATEAYKAQMGAYPTGKPAASTTNQESVSPAAQTAPALPATDIDTFALVNFTSGGAPGGVNAASKSSGSGGELMAGSNVWLHTDGGFTAYQDTAGVATDNLVGPGTDLTAAQPSRTGVGPWIKSLPKSTGHYTIWVANDGSGQIGILDANGNAIQATGATVAYNDANACAQVK